MSAGFGCAPARLRSCGILGEGTMSAWQTGVTDEEIISKALELGEHGHLAGYRPVMDALGITRPRVQKVIAAYKADLQTAINELTASGGDATTLESQLSILNDAGIVVCGEG